MSKIFILFLYSISFIYINAQSIGDTLFYSGSRSDSNLHVVFIEKPLSNYHKMVFDILWSDSGSYESKLKQLSYKYKNKKLHIKKHIIGDWISVYSYNRKNFVYYPSEPYANLFIKVTDSTVVMNNFNDGLMPYWISSLSNKKHQLRLNLISISGEKCYLLFRIKSDSTVGISSSLFNKKKISLISKEFFFELPIIVNLCPYNRCEEFNFKTTN